MGAYFYSECIAHENVYYQIGSISYIDCWELEREDIEDEIAMSLGSSSKVHSYIAKN